MYNAGTVTTTANSTKLIGTGTKWKDNNSRVSAEQVILIQNGATIYINSIASIQSNTEITLSFPVPASVSNAPYQILTTMVNSVSDATNKIVSMNVANVQFSDILNRWATESGTITVTLPDGTTQQLRTAKEMDKQLDGKFDKAGGVITGGVTVKGTNNVVNLAPNDADSAIYIQLNEFNDGRAGFIGFSSKFAELKNILTIQNDRANTNLQITDGAALINGARVLLAGDCGLGSKAVQIKNPLLDLPSKQSGFYLTAGGATGAPSTGEYYNYWWISRGSSSYGTVIAMGERGSIWVNSLAYGDWGGWICQYSTANTTKDSNGNLKAASPIVKLFADHIETNDESEGVEMEHLGVGHYLIKGVVGFNADGAWGINNGFVIPQDHNGKNMVLIDYKVRPDGDIEVFVFHQQNADLPERFQNKRIKYIDKDGNPVYYENYEPCDVPESRWIDMRVEMPVNSIYNLKQAEAERLAKEEAERQAEEAKNAEIEAEEDI
ncbi:phage tail fiber protein [Providencia stuartii]|uniref:phage tail fiber protein n=1 Tax=Providencia stuartii TaxID=588 RepID=UPI0028874FE0|nr:hypothetical protein [Providencia stuartii]MDT1068238.1 hypothetical protein [Providencia stuartii]